MFEIADVTDRRDMAGVGGGFVVVEADESLTARLPAPVLAAAMGVVTMG